MGDLLSASSLLLGVLGVLYGLWYSDIIDALRTVIPKHTANRTAPRKRITSILLSRAFPLAIGSFAVAAAFVPDVYSICLQAVAAYNAHGWNAFSGYDAIKTAFVIVEVFMVLLALHLMWLVVCLGRLLYKLGSNKVIPISDH